MERNDRQIVHEIANAFKLKSRSVGAATSRFTTVYKTSRSFDFNENTLDEIDYKLRRKRFLPRLDKKRGWGIPPPKRARGGGASGKAAGGYMDGDIVGASAAEIGVENRGRAMLEKMGWSSGTALGAMNNKGILQPVAHVVKISKAGLG